MEQLLERLHSLKYKTIDIFIDRVRKPSGRETNRLIINYPETVAIVPIINNKIVLVKQFRYPIQKEVFELPSGKIDQGETPIEACKRELLEETGYEAESVENFCNFYPAAGISTEYCHFFIATDLVKSDIPVDPDEITEVVEIDYQKLLEKYSNKNIDDPLTLIALKSDSVQNYFN